jgi:hypothetical protein
MEKFVHIGDEQEILNHDGTDISTLLYFVN